jgi:predicted SAM-dependent methyltransferase
MGQKFKTLIVNRVPLIRPLGVEYRHLRSRRRIRRLISAKRPLCIELGAGNKSGQNGWTTLDMTPSCDLYWDLRRGVPFPDDSVAKIYSSHFLEHLSFAEAQVVLDECHRALAPGGIFSISVPNAKIYIEAYMAGKSLDPSMFLGYEPAFNRTTPIDYINYTAYMAGEHKYMFDEDNLLFILERRGFRNVHSRQFDPDIDSPERRFESIYAEAVK